MKKILLTSTLLVASAGMAAADVKISGYGRFGLDYDSGAGAGVKKSVINSRLRMNIDASTETDSGVKFGGRIRLQWNSGASNTVAAPGLLYAEYEGMRLEVGNANTAYDSAALMYNSEIGYLDRGFGDPTGDYYSYTSGGFGGEKNRMGVFFSYSVGDFNARVSYVTPNQSLTNLGFFVDPLAGYKIKDEYSVSADYKFGAVTVSAAGAWNGGGVDGNNLFFVGAEYAVNDAANIGLLYFDNGKYDVYDTTAAAPFPVTGTVDYGKTITLYGNYTMGAITYKGYVANNDAPKSATKTTDTAFGIGVDYDLGGARLSGDIHRDYAKETIAGIGVRFNF